MAECRNGRRGLQRPGRAQRNFTDGDSRVLQTGDGYKQGYNGQVAVDGHRQIVIACRLTTNGADDGAPLPPIDDTRRLCGRKPRELPGGSASRWTAQATATRSRRCCGGVAAPWW